MSSLFSEPVAKKETLPISGQISKYALKLIGINNSIYSEEEVLEHLSKYIPAPSISSLMYDSHNNFYALFLSDIDSTCAIINRTLSFGNIKVKVLPLLDYYIINNVYPTLSNEDLADVFRAFGNVFDVTEFKVVPNSSKFSHVISGKREISFLLPADDKEVFLPTNIISAPYTFHAKKICCACLTEGHAVINCPDIEEECTMPARSLSLPSFDDEDFSSMDSNDFQIVQETSFEGNSQSLPECKLEKSL